MQLSLVAFFLLFGHIVRCNTIIAEKFSMQVILFSDICFIIHVHNKLLVVEQAFAL
jgi:predicted nicotinamide N-methyase